MLPCIARLYYVCFKSRPYRYQGVHTSIRYFRNTSPFSKIDSFTYFGFVPPYNPDHGIRGASHIETGCIALHIFPHRAGRKIVSIDKAYIVFLHHHSYKNSCNHALSFTIPVPPILANGVFVPSPRHRFSQYRVLLVNQISLTSGKMAILTQRILLHLKPVNSLPLAV